MPGQEDNTAICWDLKTGEQKATLRGHKDDVLCACVTHDKQYVVTTSRDNTAKVWRLSSGELVTTLRGHADDVLSVAAAHSSSRVATTSTDNTARVWDLEWLSKQEQ